jgi:hypothetical protein
LRSARLQSLLEVGPARLLAAMLGDLGVSTLRLIKTMTQFSSLFEHQTSHVVCFNARGLLYECIFDALLFSSSYRPVGKSVSHHVVTRPTFSSSFLDHHTGHSARHDARILHYECIFDSLCIFSSSFRLIGSLLPIGCHSTSLRSARLQTGRLLS